MRIRHLAVPDAVRSGTEVRLTCDYDLEVLSLKFNLIKADVIPGSNFTNSEMVQRLPRVLPILSTKLSRTKEVFCASQTILECRIFSHHLFLKCIPVFPRNIAVMPNRLF